jgi:hypothetical protein
LPSVTLGTAFAECKIAFAVCLRHTAKALIPVVRVEIMATTRFAGAGEARFAETGACEIRGARGGITADEEVAQRTGTTFH